MPVGVFRTRQDKGCDAPGEAAHLSPIASEMIGSSTRYMSIREIIHPIRKAKHDAENDRNYHNFHAGKYLLPNDEQEQDRLDFLHEVILKATGKLIHVPFHTTGRLLDLGCGTGIWAKDLATSYPKASVVGVDLSSIQPSKAPRNCEFRVPFDFEYPWGMSNDWDVIHLQLSFGSVGNWSQLYHQVIAHLQPGGWFEQIEIDYEPRCIEGGSALLYWYECLRRATEASARPIHQQCNLVLNLLQNVGFIDLGHQQIVLPLNRWHPVSQTHDLGHWYGRALFDSIEPFSLAPFTRFLGWTPQRIHRLITEVKQEVCGPRVRGFHVLHVYTARKPNTYELPILKSAAQPSSPTVQFTSSRLIA